MKERIYWTEVEQEKVVQRAAELRIANLDSALVPLILLAQEEVLPMERHRRTVSDEVIAGVKIRVEAIRKAEVDAKPPQIVTVPVKEIESVDPARFVASQPAALLVAELVNRIDRRLDRLEEAMARAALLPSQPGVYQPRPAAPAGPPLPPAKKHRIAIVGLLKDQFEHVRAKFEDRQWLELVWLDKDQGRAQFPSVDAIIVDRHSSHRWSDAAKGVVPSDKLYFADGGQSTVVQKIFDYISKQRS